MKHHLELLGLHVVDRVTGATGVVTSISFDLYGCVQAFVHPTLKTTLKSKNDDTSMGWYDVKRLLIASPKRVMDIPDFDRPEIGCESKPPISAR